MAAYVAEVEVAYVVVMETGEKVKKANYIGLRTMSNKRRCDCRILRDCRRQHSSTISHLSASN